MPMVCTICRHPDREEIEAELWRGQILDRIAEQYEISKSALYRHKENCLALQLTNRGTLQVIAADGGQGPDPIERIENLITSLEALLPKVETPKKAALFYQGARELCRAVELLERIKAHKGALFQEAQGRHDREELSEIQQLARDPDFMAQVQAAVDEAEGRLIESRG